MSATPTPTPDPAASQPIADFSACHEGITRKLHALAGLPELLQAAAQARQLAADSLAFFADVIQDHHANEETELFPAVLRSATPGVERDQVQVLVDQLVAEHRRIEALWAKLVPGLKAAAKGQDTALSAVTLQHLVDSYLAHAAFEEREFLPLSQTILGRNDNHLAALAMSLHLRHAMPEILSRWSSRI